MVTIVMNDYPMLKVGLCCNCYASVGGATRHTDTVVRLCVSVTSVVRRTLKGKL